MKTIYYISKCGKPGHYLYYAVWRNTASKRVWDGGLYKSEELARKRFLLAFPSAIEVPNLKKDIIEKYLNE